MISFSLRCRPAGHGFDGWFRSSADFERQSERGLVSCPHCGTLSVEKALMAPAVVTSRRAAAPEPAPPATQGPSAPAPAPVPSSPSAAAPAERMATVAAPPPPEFVEAYRRLQALAREVRAKGSYVGDRFAEEARRIHFGEAPARGIFGEASRAEVEALGEEGIAVLPLPPLPEDGN